MLPALAFGAVLIIAAVVVASRPQRVSGGTPRLAVDQQTIDYGYVKFGGTREFALTVTNVGDGELRFEKEPYIEVLEGC
jgi:hypothetical protein